MSQLQGEAGVKNEKITSLEVQKVELSGMVSRLEAMSASLSEQVFGLERARDTLLG